MYTSEKEPDPPGHKLLSESCLNMICRLVCVFWKTLSIRPSAKWKSTELRKATQVQLDREAVLPGLRPRICTIPGNTLHKGMLTKGEVFWNSNIYELFLVLLHRDRKGKSLMGLLSSILLLF